ncbi:hypothetical protein COCOBI_13-0230 [Coccomyxa sp. Obi]|nr:hypothetical protein COCOBI_13-0230 [Coccomyxa sp. Obi]
MPAQAAAWCALNGLGLALVMPCVQSVIAEVYTAKQRGRAFGTIFTVSALGGMLFNFLAITYGNRMIHHYPGWRVMFFVVACFAAVAAVAVFLGGIEPRNFQKDRGDPAGNDETNSVRTPFGQAVWQGLRLIFTSTRTVFRIRSFQIILLASIVGQIAFVGAGYKILYLQLLGFSDVATATLSLCFTLGIALGFLMGGWAADALAARMPYSARPFINQLSLATAGPLTAVYFKAMPGTSAHANGYPGSLDHFLPHYGFLSFAIGALSSWPASNNAAIFAEIVPESVRTSVYAFDKCITGALGALSTPLAGVLAERVFGFTSLKGGGRAAAAAHGSAGHGTTTAEQAATNVGNARALENGLLCIMLIPMAIKFILYFALYYTLKKDRLAAGEDNELLLVELTKKDSESGAEADVPELPGASGAASGEPLAVAARARSLTERPPSAELRRLRGPNRQPPDGPIRQQDLPDQAQLAEGRAQSLGTKARASIDSIDRFLDLESQPPIPTPRRTANTQPHS